MNTVEIPYYVIANTEGFELIESFEVGWKHLFAVHTTIQLTMNLEVLEEKRVVERANSFHARLTDLVREEFEFGPYDVFTKEARDRWNGFLASTHSYMTDQFEKHAEVSKKLLSDGDTTTCWIVWSDIVEKRFMV